MPAKDLGTKHVCWKCATKFYDLKKPAPLCPKCGADARAAPTAKQIAAAERKAARLPKEPVEETPELPEEEVEEDVEEPEEEADADDE